jgi:hypothetical protein
MIVSEINNEKEKIGIRMDSMYTFECPRSALEVPAQRLATTEQSDVKS